MALHVSTYKQTGNEPYSDYAVESEHILAQLLVGQVMRLGYIDLILRGSQMLVEPIFGWIGENAVDTTASIATFEINPSVLDNTNYRRVRVDIDASITDEWTPYYISLKCPEGGSFECMLASNPPASWLSDLVDYDESVVPTLVSGLCMALEMHDSMCDTATAESAPAIMVSASEIEQEQLESSYRTWASGDWKFDDTILPVRPVSCSVTEFSRSTASDTIDANRVIVTEIGSGRPDRVAGYMLDLTFPLTGREIVRWLQRYQEFDVRFPVEVPLFDPRYPEVAYSDPNDAQYLSRYYGSMGHWKEDSSTVFVWVDGHITESGYTIDYTNGCVIFDSAQADASVVVQLLYVWRPQVKLTIEPNWFSARGVQVAHPRVSLWECYE